MLFPLGNRRRSFRYYGTTTKKLDPTTSVMIGFFVLSVPILLILLFLLLK